jgi:hypothetical protein
MTPQPSWVSLAAGGLSWTMAISEAARRFWTGPKVSLPPGSRLTFVAPRQTLGTLLMLAALPSLQPAIITIKNR